MSDDPYRSAAPRVLNSHGVCLLLDQLIGVIRRTRGADVLLRNGESHHLEWESDEAALSFFKRASEALQEAAR